MLDDVETHEAERRLFIDVSSLVRWSGPATGELTPAY
jgi:hypothetical protein